MIKSFYVVASSYFLFFLSMVSSSHDSVESTLIDNYKLVGSNYFLNIRGVFLLWEAIGKATTLVTERAKASPY